MEYMWSVSADGCVLVSLSLVFVPLRYSFLFFAVLPVRKPSGHHGVGRAAELHFLAV